MSIGLSNILVPKAQKADIDICTVVSWLEEGLKSAPDKNTLMAHSPMVKSLCAHWSNLVIKDGILYRKWPDKLEPDLSVMQMIAPPCFRDEIFALLHGSKIGGHFGITRTLKVLKDRFWWPDVKLDVQMFCKGCIPCNLAKGHPIKQAKLTPMTVVDPFCRVSLDLAGPLPSSGENGQYNYILILVDYATKMIVLEPLETKTAQECADAIVRRWISNFGCMRILHGDRDPSWLSQIFQEMTKLLEIAKTHTTPFHPSSDGLAERSIKTISQMLKVLVSDSRDTWSELLPFVEMAYRATPHESTGFSPNRMTFGREVLMPIDILYKTSNRCKTRFTCTTAYVQWLRQSLEKIYSLAGKQLHKAAIRQKRNYNLNVRPPLQIGDFCYRYRPVPGKLQKSWTGPFKVVAKASDINFLIQEGPDTDVLRVHMDHLKSHVGRTPSQWLTSTKSPVTTRKPKFDQGPPGVATPDTLSTATDSDSAKPLGQGAMIDSDNPSSSDSDKSMNFKTPPRRGTRSRKAPNRLDL